MDEVIQEQQLEQTLSIIGQVHKCEQKAESRGGDMKKVEI